MGNCKVKCDEGMAKRKKARVRREKNDEEGKRRRNSEKKRGERELTLLSSVSQFRGALAKLVPTANSLYTGLCSTSLTTVTPSGSPSCGSCGCGGCESCGRVAGEKIVRGRLATCSTWGMGLPYIITMELLLVHVGHAACCVKSALRNLPKFSM